MPSGTGKTVSLLALIMAYQRVSAPWAQGGKQSKGVPTGAELIVTGRHIHWK